MSNRAGEVILSQLEVLGGQHPQVAVIWEKDTVVASFCTHCSMAHKKKKKKDVHTLSTFTLGPEGAEGGFAIPLSLTWGKLCPSHGSEALCP